MTFVAGSDSSEVGCAGLAFEMATGVVGAGALDRVAGAVVGATVGSFAGTFRGTVAFVIGALVGTTIGLFADALRGATVGWSIGVAVDAGLLAGSEISGRLGTVLALSAAPREPTATIPPATSPHRTTSAPTMNAGFFRP